MVQKDKSQLGFAHIFEFVLIAVVLLTIFSVYKFVKSRHQSLNQDVVPVATKESKPVASTSPSKDEVSWQLVKGGVWQVSGTPPACPKQPIFASPVDMSLVTAIIYPGQVRGNAFKPHGGFRFDNQPNNNVTLTVPIDSKLMRGSKGLFAEAGEVQYGFEFIAPCGIWYAFGHIHTLSPQFQAYADKLPLVKDYATQQLYDIPGYPTVKKGDIIATQVGIVHSKNVSVEWQVDDIRHKNGKTIRPEWAKYKDGFDAYGVCWLDMLPTKDAKLAKSLRGGDSVSGKQSDYCE